MIALTNALNMVPHIIEYRVRAAEHATTQHSAARWHGVDRQRRPDTDIACVPRVADGDRRLTVDADPDPADPATGCNTRCGESKSEDYAANGGDPGGPDAPDPADGSRSAMGLANAWPPAELLEALRAGAEEAIDRLVAGDVVGARHKWAEAGRLLSRQPSFRRGEPRLVTYAGRTQNVSAWARELGWSHQALLYRLGAMPLERALTPRVR
jgi:hypothetical protein